MAPSFSPGSRGTVHSPECSDSHSAQLGHQEPGCSVAASAHCSSVFAGFGLVQYWYLTFSGGLTTPAMWPEPDSTNSTGPPNRCEPANTDFAGAMWSSLVASS